MGFCENVDCSTMYSDAPFLQKLNAPMPLRNGQCTLIYADENEKKLKENSIIIYCYDKSG